MWGSPLTPQFIPLKKALPPSDIWDLAIVTWNFSERYKTPGAIFFSTEVILDKSCSQLRTSWSPHNVEGSALEEPLPLKVAWFSIAESSANRSLVILSHTDDTGLHPVSASPSSGWILTFWACCSNQGWAIYRSQGCCEGPWSPQHACTLENIGEMTQWKPKACLISRWRIFFFFLRQDFSVALTEICLLCLWKMLSPCTLFLIFF